MVLNALVNWNYKENIESKKKYKYQKGRWVSSWRKMTVKTAVVSADSPQTSPVDGDDGFWSSDGVWTIAVLVFLLFLLLLLLLHHHRRLYFSVKQTATFDRSCWPRLFVAVIRHLRITGRYSFKNHILNEKSGFVSILLSSRHIHLSIVLL